eukprot:TRINITY_DN894_c0_g3_i1.p1 TRINITY_DN894_c0_g3~~TRINITY_DN894_c0_g3_i1.p1  ORF type:complete len:561 (-),score=154.72 TRINITY_DN894_c0_g3_i1:123-1784(-)
MLSSGTRTPAHESVPGTPRRSATLPGGLGLEAVARLQLLLEGVVSAQVQRAEDDDFDGIGIIFDFSIPAEEQQGTEISTLPTTTAQQKLPEVVEAGDDALVKSASKSPHELRGHEIAALWGETTWINTEKVLKPYSDSTVVALAFIGIIFIRIWLLPYWFVPLKEPVKGFSVDNLTFTLFYEPYAVLFDAYGMYVVFWAATGNNPPKWWSWWILLPVPIMIVENFLEMAADSFPVPLLQMVILSVLLGVYPVVIIVGQQLKHKRLVASGAPAEEVSASAGIIKIMQKAQGILTVHIVFVLFCLAYLVLFFESVSGITDPIKLGFAQVGLHILFVAGEPFTMYLEKKFLKPNSRIMRVSYYWIRCHADLFVNAVLPSVSSVWVFIVIQIFGLYPIFKHTALMSEASLRLTCGDLPFEKKLRIRRSHCVILFYEFIIECLSVLVYVSFACMMRYSLGLNGQAPLYVNLSDEAFNRSLIYAAVSFVLSGAYAIGTHYFILDRYAVNMFAEGANVIRKFFVSDIFTFVMCDCVLLAYLINHVGVWPFIVSSSLQTQN